MSSPLLRQQPETEKIKRSVKVSSRKHKRPRPRHVKKRVWIMLVIALLLPAVLFTRPVKRFAYPLKYEQTIKEASAKAGVDPCLVAAVIYAESGFRCKAVSDVGAVGLMQLMPETALWLAESNNLDYSNEQFYDPKVNIELGSLYLAWLDRLFDGNLVWTLAAYNVGQHKVDEWIDDGVSESDIPYPETRCFVKKVIRARKCYQALYPKLCDH